MYSKFIKTKEFSILFCCDEELVGKTFKENGVELEVRKETYFGEKINEKELLKRLKEANNINLFGKESTLIALKKGFASEKSLISMQGVPHLQIYKLG